MQQVDLWYLSRATGVVALVLLTATTFLGVLVAGRAKSKLPSFARADAHRYISAVTVAFVAFAWRAMLVSDSCTMRNMAS